MAKTDRQVEIDGNLEYFLQQLPNLSSMSGKIALLRDRSIVDYYDTITDALKVGNSRFPDRRFSIQEVSTSASDLGYFSHAVSLGVA